MASESQVMPEMKCPACEYKMDRCTNVTGQGGPKPGDVSLCFRCGVAMAFTAELGLRLATQEDFDDLTVGARWTLAMTQRAIRQMKHERG